MNEIKRFTTYEEQIKQLKDKKLIIEDENETIRLLKEHSYFDLINGYKHPFKQSNKDYKRNTTFNDIYQLYCFDKAIRYALVERIMEVEIHIKSLLSYSFCEEFGESEQAYQDAGNYNYSTKENQEGIDKLISTISNKISSANDFPYMRHQRQKHNNIPLWVLVKTLTLGNISKMYSYQKSTIQARISKEFVGVKESDLESFLDILTRFRNVCAHNERLFDFRYRKRSIADMPLHMALGIPKKNNAYVKGKSDFLAALIALKYLLNNESFASLVDDLDNAISKLLGHTNQIQRQQLYKYMGLTDNWKDIRNIDVSSIVVKTSTID